jgi:tRNA(fMet)-specific endonuclease VapC
LVDFLRGRDPGSTAYKKWKSKANLLITSISAFELLMGAHLSSRKSQRIAEAESLIEQHIVLSLDKAAATIASQVGSELKTQGAGVEIRDLFNGAICLTRKIPILTGNRTHYERIRDLTVIHP